MEGRESPCLCTYCISLFAGYLNTWRMAILWNVFSGKLCGEFVFREPAINSYRGGKKIDWFAVKICCFSPAWERFF